MLFSYLNSGLGIEAPKRIPLAPAPSGLMLPVPSSPLKDTEMYQFHFNLPCECCK